MSTLSIFKRAAVLALLGCCAAAAQAAAPTATVQRTVTFSIESQPVREALMKFGEQAGLQVLFRSEGLTIQGVTASPVSGELSMQDALRRLLSKTGLTYEFVNERTVRVTAAGSAETASSTSGTRVGRVKDEQLQLARAQGDSPTIPAASTEEQGRSSIDAYTKGIPEILVKGARTANTDIRRTEDDVQPYVVFDAEDLERSMAPDLETFLRTRLTMNQVRSTEDQNLSGNRGNQSTVDLRGLGADQTLILVNGRRMPGVANGLDLFQPDINGIPMSAVERIEILPSTAGGIYGGGATGGVVNIILKRDYSDLELSARYDGTFAGGGTQRRLDATGGFTLEGGRTSVMVMASYRDGNPLYVGDRDATLRARQLKNQNNSGLAGGGIGVFPGVTTTNITGVRGRNLVLADGMRPLNSPYAYVPVGYAGPASDNGAVFLETAGRLNIELPEDFTGTGYPLLGAPTVRSLTLSLRREFSERVEAFVDASRNDNQSERINRSATIQISRVRLPVGPGNPFTEAVDLSVPFGGYDASRLLARYGSLSERLTGGLIMRLPREWTAQAEYSLSRSNYTQDYPIDPLTVDGRAALTDGRLNLLGDVNANPPDYAAYYPDQERRIFEERPLTRRGATLRVAGPLWQLPGGPLRLAALLEDQRQYTDDQVSYYYEEGATAPLYLYNPRIGATTRSLYTELTAPLFSAANARRGLRGLDVQASYRYDVSRTRTVKFGDVSNIVPSLDGPFPEVPFQTNEVSGNQYTLGLRYMPAEVLALRVSYGEGIFAPQPRHLAQYEDRYLLFLSGLIDPKRDGESVTGATVEKLVLQGSLQLRPEISQSWSAGAIFTPDSLPGLRLSVDYTRIEKVDEIGFLPPQTLVDLEDSLPGRVVRNPLTPADQAAGYTGGTIRDLDAGLINIAHSLVEAIDIQADYSWQTRLGAFAVNVMATVQPQMAQQPTPTSVERDRVGYSDGPLKWRANAGLRWQRGALGLGWNLQYYDAALVYGSTASTTIRNAAILTQGAEFIPTQTYHDVYGRYRFDHAPGFARGLLENTELQFSVQNVFNTEPPIVASISVTALTSGYAGEGDARLRRYSISFTKRFGQ